MPKGEKKGITVKIDADLHAEIRQYLEAVSYTHLDVYKRQAMRSASLFTIIRR